MEFFYYLFFGFQQEAIGERLELNIKFFSELYFFEMSLLRACLVWNIIAHIDHRALRVLSVVVIHGVIWSCEVDINVIPFLDGETKAPQW